MDGLTLLLTYLLSCVGLTVLVVWPESGPMAWFREVVLRAVLRPVSGLLDCYICFGFWASLAMAPFWWIWGSLWWVWFGPFMTSAVFWLVLQPRQESSKPPESESNE